MPPEPLPKRPLRTKSIDGIARQPDGTLRPASAAPRLTAQPAPTPAPVPPARQPATPPRRHTFSAPPELRPRRRWWHKLLFPLCVLLCLCASFLVQSLPLGMAAIGLYAAIAWLRKLPSRYSFVLAFLSLVTVVVLLVVRQNTDLASNFATYTFLLLVVGIVSSMFESRVNLKHKSSKITHLRR